MLLETLLIFCSFNLGVGGRAGYRNGRATIINTNTNGGATVTMNSTASKVNSTASKVCTIQ